MKNRLGLGEVCNYFTPSTKKLLVKVEDFFGIKLLDLIILYTHYFPCSLISAGVPFLLLVQFN